MYRTLTQDYFASLQSCQTLQPSHLQPPGPCLHPAQFECGGLWSRWWDVWYGLLFVKYLGSGHQWWNRPMQWLHPRLKCGFLWSKHVRNTRVVFDRPTDFPPPQQLEKEVVHLVLQSKFSIVPSLAPARLHHQCAGWRGPNWNAQFLWIPPDLVEWWQETSARYANPSERYHDHPKKTAPASKGLIRNKTWSKELLPAPQKQKHPWLTLANKRGKLAWTHETLKSQSISKRKIFNSPFVTLHLCAPRFRDLNHQGFQMKGLSTPRGFLHDSASPHSQSTHCQYLTIHFGQSCLSMNLRPQAPCMCWVFRLRPNTALPL